MFSCFYSKITAVIGTFVNFQETRGIVDSDWFIFNFTGNINVTVVFLQALS